MEMMIDTQFIPTRESFKYLRSIIQENEISTRISHINCIEVRWVKSRLTSNVHVIRRFHQDVKINLIELLLCQLIFWGRVFSSQELTCSKVKCSKDEDAR